MKTARAFLPHLCIALNLTLVLVVILDLYNPLLGMFKGIVFLILIGCCILSSVATAILLIRGQRRAARRRRPS